MAERNDIRSAAQPIGATIRIFLVDGTPDGPWIIEKSNWTGIAVMAPRSDYPRMRGRDELLRPGVYLLWGPGDSGSRVYVGEADEVRAQTF